MRTFLGLILSCLICCCEINDKSNLDQVNAKPILEGTVHFHNSTRPDSFYVGLYKGANAEKPQLGEPDTLLIISDSLFTLSPAPGYHILAAFAFGFKPLRAPLFVPDSGVVQLVDIHFYPMDIDVNAIRYVMVYGEYNNWNIMGGRKLVKKDSIWTIDASSFMKVGEHYKFFPYKNGTDYYALIPSTSEVIPQIATFHSVYNGGEIIFDPSWYAVSKDSNSAANFKGYEKQTAYQTIKQFYSVRNGALNPYRLGELRAANGEKRDSLFMEMYNEQLLLQANEGQFFPHIVIPNKIFIINRDHPAKIDFSNSIKESQKLDLNAYYSSDSYKDYFKLITRALGEVDSSFASKVYTGILVNLDKALSYAPELIETKTPEGLNPEYELGRFADVGLMWADMTPDTTQASTLLWMMAQEYNANGDKEKTRRLLQRIVAKYPSSSYVQNGYIKTMSSNMELDVGQSFPAFEFKSTDGQVFDFSDISAPYIFINIWAPGCGFSLHETENVAALRDYFSEDKFCVLGLANHPSDKDLEVYMSVKDLNYPNMCIGEELLSKFGVVAYPSSYLIGPDRKIIAKDLRGKGLVDLVQKEIGSK